MKMGLLLFWKLIKKGMSERSKTQISFIWQDNQMKYKLDDILTVLLIVKLTKIVACVKILTTNVPII